MIYRIFKSNRRPLRKDLIIVVGLKTNVLMTEKGRGLKQNQILKKPLPTISHTRVYNKCRHLEANLVDNKNHRV